MGYTTNFDGKLKFNRQLTLDEKNELDDIAEKDWRDDKSRPDEYAYFCQWVPTEDGWCLEWDGNEKFYAYVEWLKWLIEKFFTPKEIVLNGEIEWSGEEQGDIGKIIVKDNIVTTKEGKIVFD